MKVRNRGDCYDNAAMESFWATLKTELVYHERYATPERSPECGTLVKSEPQCAG